MRKKTIKYLFIIQGEGRGHITQAISLSQALKSAGHEISCVLVGKSERRVIPSFFFEKIDTPVFTFESPNFVMDKQNKGIRLFSTLTYNIRKTGFFLKNLRFIHEKVSEYQPDVIVNFYDLLAGLYNAFYSPKSRFICIGHQYLLLHPEFEFPKGKSLDKLLIRCNTYITSLKAHKKLALSFSTLPSPTKNGITVLPPLLRKEILSLTSNKHPYFLVYLLNDGYSEEIVKWHKKHPDIKLHCFWDKKDAVVEHRVDENLTFHKIDDRKFLELMKDCSGFITTAGFESICEAKYLGKPILMVPTQGHFEQQCNALDATKAGAGVTHTHFDLSVLLDYLPAHHNSDENYKNWVSQADTMFLEHLS